MKRIFLAVLLLFACIVGFAEERIVVVDAGDRGPVVGASVMTRSGVIVGITDMEGAIRSLKRSDYPVEIRSLGYEPQTISETTDTVSLVPALYPLSEVTVNPDRPITRVLCYARVFSTFTFGSDTITLFMPEMRESFYAAEKVKGYKRNHFSRIKRARAYAHLTNKNGLDSVSRFTNRDTDETFLDLADLSSILIKEIPCLIVEEPQSMREGEIMTSVNGRGGRESIFRKNGGILTYYTDFLKNKKNNISSPNILKLLGCTMDLTEQTATIAYGENEAGKYCIEDLVYGSSAVEILVRGKIYKFLTGTKEDIKMRTYAEIYPVEFTYHTVGEYKELKKDKSKVDFKLPENIQPLPPAIADIVERIESKASMSKGN